MSKILPMILAAGMSGGSGGVTIDEVKQITGELENLQTEHKDNLVNAINDLELFKFPNVTIIGDPTINHGQITDFSDLDYLEFPFLVDFRGRSFEINFNFTTGTDIDNQQNILDSDFGLAFAVKNKHLLIAVSTNGTSWAIAQEGTFQLSPQTTYDIRISWNGLSYKVSYSTNGGTSYIDDITFGQSVAPYPKQMFIGIGKLDDNYFTGSINLNKANLKIAGEIIWQGMDDVGLSTRLATDLSNIDNAGIERIKDIAGGGSAVYTMQLSYTGTNLPTNYNFNNDEILQLEKILEDVYTNNYPTFILILGFANRRTAILTSEYENFQKKPSRPKFRGLDLESDVRPNTNIYVTSNLLDLILNWSSGLPKIDNEYRNGASLTCYSGNLLNRNNTAMYDVTNDYNPAHKKYVDDAIASAITTTLEGEY